MELTNNIIIPIYGTDLRPTTTNPEPHDRSTTTAEENIRIGPGMKVETTENWNIVHKKADRNCSVSNIYDNHNTYITRKVTLLWPQCDMLIFKESTAFMLPSTIHPPLDKGRAWHRKAQRIR